MPDHYTFPYASAFGHWEFWDVPLIWQSKAFYSPNSGYCKVTSVTKREISGDLASTIYSAQHIFLSQVLAIYTYFHPKPQWPAFSTGTGSKTRPKEGYLNVILHTSMLSATLNLLLSNSSLHQNSPDHVELVHGKTLWKLVQFGFGPSELI